MSDVWEVFLTPHTDDEVIGMAGAITRAHLAGMKTLVVLVTDNLPSVRQQRVFEGRTDLASDRLVEWHKAMRCLLVDEIEIWNVPEALMPTGPFAIQAMIDLKITALLAHKTVAHLHTVIGSHDIHAEVGYGSLSHTLCANCASHYVTNIVFPDVRVSLHGVYVYSKPLAERTSIMGLPIVADQLSQKEWTRKREALACYKASEDTIGYGYTSVPELFDAAETDPHEYVVELTSDIVIS